MQWITRDSKGAMAPPSCASTLAGILVVSFAVAGCSTDEGSSPDARTDGRTDVAGTGGTAGGADNAGGNGGSVQDASREDGGGAVAGSMDGGTPADAHSDVDSGSCTFGGYRCPEGFVNFGGCVPRVSSAVPSDRCSSPGDTIRFRWCECVEGCDDVPETAPGRWWISEPLSCEGRLSDGCICEGAPGPCIPGEIRGCVDTDLWQQCSCDGSEWGGCKLQDEPLNCYDAGAGAG